MADNAGLNLNVEYGSVTGASNALGTFQTQSRGAGAGARSMRDEIDNLSASVRGMMDVQRRSNDMMGAAIQAQRESSRAIEDNISSMTRWNVIMGASTTIWSLFKSSSTDATSAAAAGMQTLQKQAQGVHDTLGQVLDRMDRLQHAQRDTFKGATGTLFNATGVGQFLGAGGIDPFGAQAINREMAQLRQQLSDFVNTTLLDVQQRSGTPASTLAQAIPFAARMGGGDDYVKIFSDLDRSLKGVSPSAVQAQRTMRDLGVSTRDTADAFKQVLDALSRMPSGQQQTDLFRSVFPSGDPAILRRVGSLFSGGPAGDNEFKQLQQAMGMAGANAQAGDVLGDYNMRRSRQFFGMMPIGPFGPVAQRFSEFGQVFDSQSPLWQREQQFRLLMQSNASKVGQGDRGILSGLGRAGSLMGQDLQNALHGLTFGLVSAPEFDMGELQRPAAERIITPEQRAAIQSYEMRQGRMSQASMDARIKQERTQGDALVAQGLLEQPQHDKNMENFAERMRRMARPVEYALEQMQDLDVPTAGMDPRDARRFRATYTLGREARRSGEDFNPDSVDAIFNQQEAAHATKALEDFASNLQKSADILNLPPGQQVGARAQLSAREAMYPGVSYGNLPQLTPEQQREVARAGSVQAGASGTNLMAETQRQIEENSKLAGAYKDGTGNVTSLTAAYRAQTEAIKGMIDPLQQTARAAQLMSLNMSEMEIATQKMIRAAQLDTSLAGSRAGAAGGGPVAVRRQEIINSVRKEFDERLQNAAPDDVGVIQQEMAKVTAERLKQADLNAQTSRGVVDYNARQRMGDLGFGAALTSGSNPATPSELATLAEIHRREGGGSYDTFHANKQRVGSLADVEAFSGRSHAFGGYGFQPGTYREMSRYTGIDPNDISPDAQDRNALELLRRRGANSQGSWAESGPYGAAGARSNTSDLIARRNFAEARQQLQGEGVTEPTNQQIQARAQQSGTLNTADQAINTQIRSRDTERTVELEKQLVGAIGEGVQAEKDMETRIRVEHEFRKLIAEAQATGNEELVKGIEAQKEKVLGLERERNAIQSNTALAKEQRDFKYQQGSTAREISALESGGTAAYDLQTRAEPIAKRLIDAGVDEETARKTAEDQAKQASAAEDYKKAILDASNELKSGTKQAIEALTSGLATSVGHGVKLKDALRQAALNISGIGVKMFVTKPLETLANNVLSGKGFNFDVGNSGKDTSDVMGAALGGLKKSLGLGGGKSGKGGLGDIFGSKSKSGSSINNGDYSNLSGSDFDFDTGSDLSAADFSDYSGFDDVGSFHGGGVAGFGGGSRHVPVSAFYGAPRFHRGGLLPDEMPIIAKRGERVLNQAETKAYDSNRSRGSGPVNVVQNIYTPDVHSFRATTSQTMNASRAAADRAYRNV